MPCLRLRDAEKLMAEMDMTLGVPVSMPPMSGTLAKLLHDVAIDDRRRRLGPEVGSACTHTLSSAPAPGGGHVGPAGHGPCDRRPPSAPWGRGRPHPRGQQDPTPPISR